MWLKEAGWTGPTYLQMEGLSHSRKRASTSVCIACPAPLVLFLEMLSAS